MIHSNACWCVLIDLLCGKSDKISSRRILVLDPSKSIPMWHTMIVHTPAVEKCVHMSGIKSINVFLYGIDFDTMCRQFMVTGNIVMMKLYHLVEKQGRNMVLSSTFPKILVFRMNFQASGKIGMVLVVPAIAGSVTLSQFFLCVLISTR